MNDNPPNKPTGDALGAPGSTTASNVSHKGATELSADTTLNAPNYSSSTGGENALLVTGGEINLANPTIAKSGDESSENSDFYGTNAAVLAAGGAVVIDGGIVSTNGAHANALFSYGEDSSIIATNTKVTTSKDNSGGIMVTGGGHFIATDLTVETSGRSSAAIRSDRGGGVIAVTGGTYTSNGVGSPAIYSTAMISTNGATLVSTKSEGVVIEGSNSVSLFDSTLTDTNTELNGNSETYKNIFIYQSMSGDAEEGTGYFYASGSTITTNAGDTFYITNTTAEIELSNNKIINNDTKSAFLRAEGAKWGTAGANGGDVTLTLTGQVIEGDIILDELSTLDLKMEQSYYMGALNAANTAKSVSVTLDATSNLVLAGDTYLTTLTNADTTNMNIYSNGYKLYVAGSEVAVNGSEAPAVPEVVTTTETTTPEVIETVGTTCQETFFTNCDGGIKLPILVAGIALVVILVAVIAFVIHNKKKKGPKAPEAQDLGNTVPTPATPTPDAPTPTNPFAPESPVQLATPAQPTPQNPVNMV